MKCFYHVNEDARAVCKKCGKGMCIDCSATSQHKGYCPSCALKVFIKRLFWTLISLILIPAITYLLYNAGVVGWIFNKGGMFVLGILAFVEVSAIIILCLKVAECVKLISVVKRSLRQGTPIHKK